MLALVESWLNYLISHNDFVFTGFNIVRHRIGGIEFIIRKNIAFHSNINLQTPHNDLELHGIKLTNFQNPVTVVAAYKPPDVYLTQDNWDSLINNLNSFDNVIIIGDFNSHNKTWNCDHKDISGSRLLKSLNSIDNII